MSTSISICTSALLMIGADEISSFSDETREAKLCANLYPTTRDSLLQQHPWRFSLGQVKLAKLTDKPLYGYSYAYQLPSGFLRVIEAERGEFSIYEDAIYSNQPELNITYQFRPQETAMPAYFSRVLELKMAEILAVAVSEELAKSNVFAEKVRQEVIRARSIDSQQQTNFEIESNNFLLTEIREV